VRRLALFAPLVLVASGCASEDPAPLGIYDLPPLEDATKLSSIGVVGSAAGRGRVLQIDLPNALAVSGARSVDVRFASEKAVETRQGIYAAWASLLPWISPGIALHYHRDFLQETDGPFKNVTKQSEFGGLGAFGDWEPGNVVFRALAASRRTDAAEAATDTARAESALQVAETYYELVRAHAVARIARYALREAKGLEHDEKAKLRLGAGIQADVLRATAEVAQKELELTRAETDVKLASARLAAVLKLEPSIEVVPVEMLMPEETPIEALVPQVVNVSNEVPLDQLLSKAFSSRPELRQSESLIAAAKREHEGAKWGGLVPGATGGLATGQLGAVLDRTSPTNDMAIAVGWRVGPGGLFDVPAINAAAARVREARIQDEGLRIEIERQVVTAHELSVAAEKEIATAQKGVASATEALRLTKLRFEKGDGIQLEVLEAERALTASQMSEVGAVIDFDRAQYRLLRAIGDPIRASR